MAIRSILMPVVSASATSSELLGGITLAQAHFAHLEAVFVRPDPDEAFAHFRFDLDPADNESDTAQMRDWIDRTGRAEAAAVRHRFGALCRKAGLQKMRDPDGSRVATTAWRTLTGQANDVIPSVARGADLSLFTASSSRYSTLFESLLEVTMLRSGRPVLMVPAGGPGALSQFRRPLIAWNGASSCARAISAWLDIAEAGAGSTVLHVDEGSGVPPDMSEVVAHLGWHGIPAEESILKRGFDSVGATILAGAEAMGADLIVMGGYGHSRYGEALFGGVTRHVIRHAGVPVLMAH